MGPNVSKTTDITENSRSQPKVVGGNQPPVLLSQPGQSKSKFPRSPTHHFCPGLGGTNSVSPAVGILREQLSRPHPASAGFRNLSLVHRLHLHILDGNGEWHLPRVVWLPNLGGPSSKLVVGSSTNLVWASCCLDYVRLFSHMTAGHVSSFRIVNCDEARSQALCHQRLRRKPVGPRMNSAFAKSTRLLVLSYPVTLSNDSQIASVISAVQQYSIHSGQHCKRPADLDLALSLQTGPFKVGVLFYFTCKPSEQELFFGTNQKGNLLQACVAKMAPPDLSRRLQS